MALGVFLKERGVQYGIAGSVIWHLFWLFAITVTFIAGPTERKPTRIQFIGPVLSDDAFNTLVALKPEISETFYRTPESLAGEILEPEIGNLGHQAPGDVVSVPMGRAAWNLLRGTLGRSRGSGGIFDEKLSVDILKSPYPVTGDLKKRDLFFLPPAPDIASGEGVFEITADASGKVIRAANIESTGSAESDLAWQKYLEAWQFMPVDAVTVPIQSGRVRVAPARSAQP